VFKSVYEFTKAFSMMFLLSGLCFLFQEMYFLAFITMFSFFAIKFIDSDWAFDNFKFSNHNLVVILITFGLIFVNVFTIYQELRFSPLLTRVSAADKESYIIYENGLYSTIGPCVEAHNNLIDKLNSNKTIYDGEVKNANGICYRVIDDIHKQVVPMNFPSEVIVLCERTKEDFKKIAVNLASYNYSANAPQQGIVIRVKDNLESALKNMTRIREIMHMNQGIEEKKRSFIKL